MFGFDEQKKEQTSATATPDYKIGEIDFAYEINRHGPQDLTRYVSEADGQWKSSREESEGRVAIACGGDLMCEPAMSEASYFDGEYDFRPCFKFIRPVLQGCDLAIANLETICSERFPYAREKHRVDHHTGVRYHCNAPVEYLDALKYAGFDGFVLANNHNADGGYEGIVDTLDHLDERRFMHTGMFRSRDENRVLYVNVKGIRLAILSYTEHINRQLDKELLSEEGCRVMLNHYSKERAAMDIGVAKANGADFVLVYIHLLGREYSHTIIDRQRRTVQEIADAGADCIMGSHMHCIQAYERVTSKDGRSVPVVHSLGNLITSDNTSGDTRRSIIYKMVLGKAEDGSVVLIRDSYVPCRTVEGVRQSAYAVFPTQPAYRNNRTSTFFEGVQKTIGEEIGSALPLDVTSNLEELDPQKVPFDVLRTITVGKICKVIGVDPEHIPVTLREIQTPYVTARYTWVRKGCAYFSRYLGAVEEQEARWAVERGAAVVFTSRQFSDADGRPLPTIIVEDPAQCFYDFYRWLKSLYQIPTMAVTGSVGKTTTKEMIHAVLSEDFNVLKNVGNANTYAAIGDTIQKLTKKHEIYVQEVCAFSPGWVEGGGRMLGHDMCLITNIGYPHVDLYGTIENIFYDKTSLIRQLPADGVAFLNADDERLRTIETDRKVITFAIHHDADYKAENIEYGEGVIRFDLRCEEGVFPIVIHMYGEHNVLNALAAFAVGRYLGMAPASIQKGLDEYRSEGMRQNVLDVGGYHLYMDCYNSAPNSVLTSVHALAIMDGGDDGRKIAVLGDIPRLGDQADAVHTEVAKELLKETGIDEFLLFGPHCAQMYKVLQEGSVPVFYTQDREELNDLIRSHANRGDILLFKAGHPTALAKTVDQVFGTSFHITDGDVLLDDAHDATNADYRARWIDGAIEVRAARKKETIRRIPETTDGSTKVIRIGKDAFSNAIMEELYLPDTLENIGYAAFYNCKQLKRIHFGKNVKILERSAFNHCPQLSRVDLPEGLLEIGERAFKDCGLKDIYIPASVGHIYPDAFEGCANLTIHCKAGSYAESFAKEHGIKCAAE